MEKILSYIDIGKQEGATVLMAASAACSAVSLTMAITLSRPCPWSQ